MSFKVYLWDNLSPIEWSQAAWRIEGEDGTNTCRQELLHDVMMAHLPKDGIIVDAGCGTARWPIYLRKLGYRCVGLEISRDAIGLARGVDAQLPILQSDTRRAPVRTGSASGVISLGVVEHEEAGPDEGLRELRRMLKPGGILVCAVPFNNLFRRLVVNHLMRLVTWRRRGLGMKLGFAEYRFSRPELRAYLDRAGFDVIGEFPNDLRPPKIMGLWVDADNLVVSPFRATGPEQLFVMTGLRGRLARATLEHFPWLVCGEVVFVARAR